MQLSTIERNSGTKPLWQKLALGAVGILLGFVVSTISGLATDAWGLDMPYLLGYLPAAFLGASMLFTGWPHIGAGLLLSIPAEIVLIEWMLAGLSTLN